MREDNATHLPSNNSVTKHTDATVTPMIRLKEEIDQTNTVPKLAYCHSYNETLHQVVLFYSVVM